MKKSPSSKRSNAGSSPARRSKRIAQNFVDDLHTLIAGEMDNPDCQVVSITSWPELNKLYLNLLNGERIKITVKREPLKKKR